jgi:hypothetical protein
MTVATTGLVRVEGTIDGQALSAAVLTEVRPRSWSDRAPLKINYVVNPGILHSKPESLGALGHSWGYFKRNDPFRTDWQAIVNDSGPNHNFFWLLDIPAWDSTHVNVNSVALTDTSAFWRIQEPKDKTIGGVKYCGRDWVAWKFRPLADAHEGTWPDTMPNSHTAIHRANADSLSRRLFEPFASRDPGGITTLIDSIDFRADRDMAAMDSSSRNALNNQRVFPCRFKFNYPTSP